MENKSVILLSGGMDSATLLGYAIEHGESVECISFDYGSKHNDREWISAQEIARFFRVSLKRINLPFIDELFESDLLKSGGEIPEGHYEDSNMKKTVVPFRNGIMISIAAGYAESIGASKVYLAAHSGDHAIYPDCRDSFRRWMNEAVRAGTDDNVRLFAPFIADKKRDIVNIGMNFAIPIPYHLTYSCYKGGNFHCGKCGTCIERKEAFELSGFEDPTIYFEVK